MNEMFNQFLVRFIAGFEDDERATEFVSDLIVLQWLNDACGLVNMHY